MKTGEKLGCVSVFKKKRIPSLCHLSIYLRDTLVIVLLMVLLESGMAYLIVYVDEIKCYNSSVGIGIQSH